MKRLVKIILVLLVITAMMRTSSVAWPSFIASPYAQRVTWKHLQVTSSPPSRAAQAMAYDPVSRKIVLFGGYNAAGYLNDTWTFDGRTWKREVSSQATLPESRAAGGMAFDAVSKKLVLFGGFHQPNHLGDTWLWDGATSSWKPAHPRVSPPAMTGVAAFTDPVGGYAEIYGGSTSQFYQYDTWRWRGVGWEKLQRTNAPTARASMVAATDPERHSTVIFGGLADVNPVNTWTWDGSDWTRRFPTVQPPWRYGSGAAFDPALRAVVAFAGGSGGRDLNDTWAWTGTNWVSLSPMLSPSPRESFGLVYDATLGHPVLFGGKFNDTFYNDTWELLP